MYLLVVSLNGFLVHIGIYLSKSWDGYEFNVEQATSGIRGRPIVLPNA